MAKLISGEENGFMSWGRPKKPLVNCVTDNMARNKVTAVLR